MIDLRYVKKLIEMLDGSSVDSVEISTDKGMKIRISKSPHNRGAVQEANERARALISPGMTGQQADAIARDALTARGFGEAFGHGLGHGLGIEVHEAPRLSRVAEGSLPEGAVVTIEPGVYLPGWGGVRIEDDVHLTAGGAELLTDFPRDLIELG